MSSLTISTLCGKQHSHIVRDLRNLDKQGVIGLSKFGLTEKDKQNKSRTVYHLPKRETLILTSGYNAIQRAAIIDRWMQLESGAFNLPQSMSEALRLAADEHDARIEAESRLAIAAPKADALDRIATHCEGSMNVTTAAKSLQLKPKKVFSLLSGLRWIYRRAGNGSWIAYQNRIQSGLLEHKVSIVERPDGSERVVEQVRVTAKGLAKLSTLLSSNDGGMLV